MNFFKKLLLIGIVSCIARSEEGDDEKQSAAVTSNTDTRCTAIETEISHLKNHAWAGEYYQGDGLGVNVRLLIAPTNGFAFTWHGCLGLYDQNFGSVIETNGILNLTFALKNERRGFQGLSQEFLPVHWGLRTYLVASDEMNAFCNDVNSGREPRRDMHGRHLLREGDEKMSVKGEPDVPAEFRPHLLKSPITAKIIAVGKVSTRPSIAKFKFKDIEVTLDAGMKDGLLPGMELTALSRKAFDSVKITRCEEANAVGVITQIGEEYPMPMIGSTFSTKR